MQISLHLFLFIAYNAVMKSGTLYDRDIHEPLFEFLEDIYGTIRIIEEKQMGKSRADAVMVTPNSLYGIEIKSDADTYTRLKRQVKDYDKYFDFNYIVAGTSHAMHIEEHVPEYWGIITVETENDRPDFYILRHPKRNPKAGLQRKLSILWRTELVHIQERNKMPAYKQKSKKFVQEKILAKLKEEDLSREISMELFERDYTLIEEEIENYKKKEAV